MNGSAIVLVGLVLAAGLAPSAAAEVVYLTNGSRLMVESWRETDDSIEFFVGGGKVWISKAEITKIEEVSLREALAEPAAEAGPTPAGSARPAPAPVRPLLDPVGAAKRMLALLKQGEALFVDSFLSPAQKVRAAQWLDDRWRGFDVPEALRQAYGKGYRALRLAAEAFVAQWEGGPDAGARMAEAALAVKGAETELQPGSAPSGGRGREEEVLP